MKLRKRLVIAALLAALLTGLVILLAYLSNTHRESVELYNTRLAQLEQRTRTLEEMEADLAALQAAYQAQVQEAEDRTAEAEALLAQAEALEKEKAALMEETEQLLKSFEEMRQQLLEEDGDQAYYLEVYDALTEGLNKVKGYIAGN